MWKSFTFVDCVIVGWMVAVSVLISVQSSRVPAARYLGVNVVCIVTVLLLARISGWKRATGFLHDWYPLAMFIVIFEETAQLSFVLVDGWRDGYILAFEAKLFAVPPTVWLNRVSSPFLTDIMDVGYFSYFLLLMIVGGAVYKRPLKREFRQVMTASVLAYLSCCVFFLLFPTEGPAHTLPGMYLAPLRGGPFHWLVLLIQNHAGVHGNAFPSSHVAAGVVALIFAWAYVPRLGLVLSPLVALLCLGAVNDRYHYVSDVFGGVLVGVVCSALVLASDQLRAENRNPEPPSRVVRRIFGNAVPRT